MKAIWSRLGNLTALQAVLEVLGLLCITLAAFLVAVPLGLLVLGLALLLLGNVRVTR